MVQRAAVLALVVASGCGRIGFDARSDGQTDGTGPLGLPWGGQMNHVIVAPSGDWYAISETAGAFRSTNRGMSWARCGARRTRRHQRWRALDVRNRRRPLDRSVRDLE
jgi:hypothetical protein